MAFNFTQESASDNLPTKPQAQQKITRNLSDIAYEIRRVWPKVHYAAEPYLAAMMRLGTLHDKYYYDDARSIVLYFLSNARTWKGEDAKRIKAELKALLGGK